MTLRLVSATEASVTVNAEAANCSDQNQFQVFGNAGISLPWKLSLSSNRYDSGKQPFNR